MHESAGWGSEVKCGDRHAWKEPSSPLESTLSDEKLFIAEVSRAKRNTVGKKMW